MSDVAEARARHTYVMAHACTTEAIARAARCGVRTIEHGNLVDEDAARVMAECGAYAVPTTIPSAPSRRGAAGGVRDLRALIRRREAG